MINSTYHTGKFSTITTLLTQRTRSIHVAAISKIRYTETVNLVNIRNKNEFRILIRINRINFRTSNQNTSEGRMNVTESKIHVKVSD